MTKSKFPSVETSKQRIETHKENLLDATATFFSAGSGIYVGHFVYAAIANRVLSNIHGFLLMCKEKNFLCAASILRQQIDTAIRTNAFSLVEDRNALSERIFAGERFSDVRDINGKKMSDFYLRQKLAEQYPWIESVYTETSDSVHLSRRHIFAAIGKMGVSGEMEFVFSGLTDRPVEEFDELFAAFEHSVRMTFEVLFPNIESQ